jgi:hypothetical protein
MEQKSFLKRTAIPVLLAIILVTGIQLMPRALPAALIPPPGDTYLCRVTLLEEGIVSHTLDLTDQESMTLRTFLQTARVQHRGQAGDITGRHPLLYQLTFTPVGEGETYELLLDPEGRLFAGDKLYKLQGANPQELAGTVQSYLSAGAATP